MLGPHDRESMPGSHGGPSIFELQTAYGWSTSHLGGNSATEELMGHMDISQQSVVLDFGCGAGEAAFQLAERYQCRVFGVDRSYFNIAIAMRRAGRYGLCDRVRFCCADAEHLPFVSATFSHVLVQSVLAFLPDAHAAAGEIRRVLRDDGRIAMNEGASEPGIETERTPARLNAAGYGFSCFRSPERWKSLLTDSGFIIRYFHHQEGKTRRPIAGVLWWVRYTTSRIGRLLIHNAGAPKRWRGALLFLDLFRLYAFRQPAFLLVVAERRSDGVAHQYKGTHLVQGLVTIPMGGDEQPSFAPVGASDAAHHR